MRFLSSGRRSRLTSGWSWAVTVDKVKRCNGFAVAAQWAIHGTVAPVGLPFFGGTRMVKTLTPRQSVSFLHSC